MGLLELSGNFKSYKERLYGEGNWYQAQGLNYKFFFSQCLSRILICFLLAAFIVCEIQFWHDFWVLDYGDRSFTQMKIHEIEPAPNFQHNGDKKHIGQCVNEQFWFIENRYTIYTILINTVIVTIWRLAIHIW